MFIDRERERENGLVVSKTCSLRERERWVMKIELEATMDPLVSFRWKENGQIIEWNDKEKSNKFMLVGRWRFPLPTLLSFVGCLKVASKRE